MNQTALLPVVVAALATAAHAQTLPFVHVQTDKGRYRLGDTLRARVHLGDAPERAFPLQLRLVRGGAVLGETTLQRAAAPAWKVLLDPQWAGGACQLEARGPQGRLLHSLPLELYDTELPSLRLRLKVLGEVYQPGEAVTATLRALDRRGRPIRGVRPRLRADFGPLVIEEEGQETDREGWVTLRFLVPKEAQTSGHLAVGLKHKRDLAAVAAPIHVSASVGRIDAFPEGGAIVTGHPQRLALLVRDLDGQPTAAEGRIVDDRGASVGVWQSDRYGHALIDVPYAKERSYELLVTRPQLEARFALPQDTGHPYSLRITRDRKGNAEVEVRAREGESLKGVELALATVDGYSERKTLHKGKATWSQSKLLRVRHLLVERKDRALLKAPLLFGQDWPFEVRLTPREDQVLLPGREAVIDVETRFNGAPMAADLALSVFHGASGPERIAPIPGLASRALLQPYVHDGLVRAGADLFAQDPATRARLHAYLLVRGGYAFPPEGVALVGKAKKRRPPAREVGRLEVPHMQPRPPVQLPERDMTKRRLTGLDRLLLRAPFVRSAPLREATEPRVVRRLPKGKRRPTPGFGELDKGAPQDQRVGWKQVDDRDTRFWSAQVRTDAEGRATVRFPIGHEVAPLAIEAQGTIGDAGAAARASIEVQSEVATRFELPERLRLGDQVELWVEVEPRDGRQLPYSLTLELPPCLRSLDRVRVEKDPRRHGARTKFRVEAVAEAELTEARLVVVRGAFVETHRRPLVVSSPQPVLSISTSGQSKSGVATHLTIPRDAVPGSVVARSTVSPSGLGSAVEGLDSLLRTPHGCFEQTTSSNYPNLMVLSALLEQGADAALLERAYGLATAGFERIKTFQHEEGGFSLWQATDANEKDQELRYTAMAVAQLAHYSRIFPGKGRVELQRALDWIDAQGRKGKKLGREEHLFTALALAEADLPWKELKRATELRAKGHYQQALQTNVLLALGERVPAKQREQALAALERSFVRMIDREGGDGGEQGIMGSVGLQLQVETAGLMCAAFQEGQRVAAARKCRDYLLSRRHSGGGWYGTQATVQAVRALADYVPKKPQAFAVTFNSRGIKKQKGAVAATRHRPLELSSAVPSAEPGKSLSMTLAFRSEVEVPYSISCTYRAAQARSSAKAPYRLLVDSPALIDVGGEAEARVRIERRPGTKLPQGQVVARIELPGGMKIDEQKLSLAGAGVSHHEVDHGTLVLYFERGPSGGSLTVPVIGVEQGRYRAGPSSIYPYYAEGYQAYAQARALRVLPAGSSEATGTGPVGQASQASQATGAGNR